MRNCIPTTKNEAERSAVSQTLVYVFKECVWVCVWARTSARIQKQIWKDVLQPDILISSSSVKGIWADDVKEHYQILLSTPLSVFLIMSGY